MNAHRSFLLYVISTISLADFLWYYDFPLDPQEKARVEDTIRELENKNEHLQDVANKLRQKLEENGQLKVYTFSTLLKNDTNSA